MPNHPAESDVARLCAKHFASVPKSITRFTTGLCHFVYEVTFEDDRQIVARLALHENQSLLAGGIFWSQTLRPLGIPLPYLLHADANACPFPYMILHRLPGIDLAHIYETLTSNQKKSLARDLSEIQEKVASLPPGKGFGFVIDPSQPFPHTTWRSVLEAALARSRTWTESAGIIPLDHFAKIDSLLDRHDAYLTRVAPIPFLDDITTKNVLIHNGSLAGIVDVDMLCYGDSLYTLALTRMALLAQKLDTDYINHWIKILNLIPSALAILDLYTAIHCSTFLGEIGQRFNRPHPTPIDKSEIHHLLTVMDQLCK